MSCVVTYCLSFTKWHILSLPFQDVIRMWRCFLIILGNWSGDKMMGTLAVGVSKLHIYSSIHTVYDIVFSLYPWESCEFSAHTSSQSPQAFIFITSVKCLIIHNCKLILWCRVLLKVLTVTQLVKNKVHYQVNRTCHCTWMTSPHPRILFL
jgi:hypothetical protein